MFHFVDSVQPMLIETPKVREAGSGVDTSQREFRNGTVIELTCTGQIGSDQNAVGHYSNTILKYLVFWPWIWWNDNKSKILESKIKNLRRFNIWFVCRLSGGVLRQLVPRLSPGCRTQLSTLWPLPVQTARTSGPVPWPTISPVATSGPSSCASRGTQVSAIQELQSSLWPSH